MPSRCELALTSGNGNTICPGGNNIGGIQRCRNTPCPLEGTAMYLAQERYDLQFTTKTLASCLQNPTKAAWALLGRLVGYLRFSGEFGLKMNKTKKGSTFSQMNLGVSEEKERNQLEVYI